MPTTRSLLPARTPQPVRTQLVIPPPRGSTARPSLISPAIIASRASRSVRPSLPAHPTMTPRRPSGPPRSSLPLRGSIAMQARTSMPAPLTRRSHPPQSGAVPTTPESRARAVGWLRDWSRQQCGISFSDEQTGVLEVRLESFCRDVNLNTDALQARIAAGDRALTRKLADAVSTNYTFFFREQESFEFLRTRVLPSFVGVEPLRIWSAASSTGEEAHSIGILLREELGADATRARILGTDLSERALRTAEQGIYRGDALGTISAERRARWFAAAGVNQYKVHDDVRKLCTFRRLNLLQRPWPFEHRFHVIFLRNVLYYFEPDVRRQILEACFEAIEPRGFLVTSLTEPMTDMQTRWTAVAPAVFTRGAR